MSLTVQNDDVLLEVKRNQKTANVSIANADAGNTVMVIIDTPSAEYKISKESVLEALQSIPEIAGAVGSGNYAKVLDLIVQNLGSISQSLLGFSFEGFIVPSFNVRQSDGGLKHYHCKLEHFVNVKRQPVSLFEFLLAKGGTMRFFTGASAITSEEVLRSDSSRTVTLKSEVALSSDQKDLPYFSSAIFGIAMVELPTESASGILAALARLLLQDLEASVTVEKTIITVREVADFREFQELEKRLALRAPISESKRALAVATLDAVERLAEVGKTVTGASLRYLVASGLTRLEEPPANKAVPPAEELPPAE